MTEMVLKPTLSLLRKRFPATQFAPATASALVLGLTVPSVTKESDPSAIINADPNLAKNTRSRQSAATARFEQPPVAQDDGCDGTLIVAANEALAADRKRGELSDNEDSSVIASRYGSALKVLIETPAASVSAGVRAKAQAVWNEMHGQTPEGGPFGGDDLDRLAYSLAGDVLRLTAPPEGSLRRQETDLEATAQNPNPDAELIDLGQEFTRQDAIYQTLLANLDPTSSQEHLDQECDEQFCRVANIACALEPLRAQTLDGVMVKARAIGWIHQDEGVENLPSQGGCTNERLAYSIVRDLLTAGRMIGIPAADPALKLAASKVRELPEVETASTLSDDEPEGTSSVEPDADLIALCGLYLSAEKARCAADGVRDEVEVASWREADPEKKAELLKA